MMIKSYRWRYRTVLKYCQMEDIASCLMDIVFQTLQSFTCLLQRVDIFTECESNVVLSQMGVLLAIKLSNPPN
jgi:hypothetical protein